jgi:hypothetical protein
MSSSSSSIMISSMLILGLSRSMKEVAKELIKDCCTRNGLNVEEELRIVENLKIVEKQSKKEKKSKNPKKEIKIPMPFSKSTIKEDGCCGVSYNHGLFTQCVGKKMENGSYCGSCQSEADKNTSGEPNNGTISTRLEKELYEFKDPKGRKAISYLKVLEKLKLTKESALTEANRLNIEINEAHLTELVKEKKITRGRPKKSRKIVEAENVTDLFAKLTADVSEDIPTVEEGGNLKKKSKLSDEEKEAKKAKLAAEKEAKKAELAAEKEAKKAELEAKKQQAKKEREEKRNQEKAEKAAAKKTTAKKQEKKSKPVVEEVKPVVEETKTPEKVTVTRATINGKQYLKSSNNILYDTETKEEVGLWDPESKTIRELPDDEEEEEEEYEEED